MGLLTGLFRRSLENPSTPLSAPDDWLFDSLGSFRASSGVNVNRETALTYDAYWRCVSLISGDVAKLPLTPYKRAEANGQRTKTEDEDHPAYPLLHLEACPGEVSALDFKRTLTMHALTEGNGYAYIMRDGAGRPIELWPLSPMKTYPVRENRRLMYVTEFGDKQQRKLPAEDVFHLKGLSFDGLVGYSAVAKMREALGLGLAYENFGSIYFRNNARPNVVLKHPGRLKPEAKQNLRESWERMHSGLENANRTAVLEEGMDLSTVSINARDSQLLEGKTFSRTVVANFFGVPPHKVGDNSRTSYNSLEQENEAYVEDGGGLGFWLPAWCIEAWRKLLTEEEKESRSHFFHFKTRHLLRANLTARTTYYVAMKNNGILNADEIREEEGYNPIPGGKGQEYTRPMNEVPPGTKPEPAPGPAAGDGQQPPAKKGKPPKDPDGRAVAAAARELVLALTGRADGAARRPETFLAFVDGVTSDALPDVAATVRAELLAAAECRPADLRRVVALTMGRLAGELPAALLEHRGKKPSRSIDEALHLLKQLPDVSKGKIAVLMPAHKEPPYTLDPEDLKDLPRKWVRLHELHATQETVGREEVRALIQGSLLGGHRSAQVGRPMPEGFPDDAPYVVRHEGKLYVHNGHHRATAAQLLGMTRIKAYLYEDAGKRSAPPPPAPAPSPPPRPPRRRRRVERDPTTQLITGYVDEELP